jgi:hypothetical protein
MFAGGLYMRVRTLVLTILGLLVLEGSALAAPKGQEPEDIKFDDADKLTTSSLGPDEGKISTRSGPVRTILVRPRISFVPEMLKSIENL